MKIRGLATAQIRPHWKRHWVKFGEVVSISQRFGELRGSEFRKPRVEETNVAILVPAEKMELVAGYFRERSRVKLKLIRAAKPNSLHDAYVVGYEPSAMSERFLVQCVLLK